MGSAFQNKDVTTSSMMQTEDPSITQFRNSLYPQISAFTARARQPVYGDAERAGFTNRLNQNFGAAEKGLAARLAGRTGSVNSGAYASGLQNMFRDRLGEQADYETKIPMLNRQYGDQQTMAGMNMWNAAAGPALRGQNSKSETVHKQGWGNMLASAAGSALGFGLGMGGFGGIGKGIGGIFGKRPKYSGGGFETPFDEQGWDPSTQTGLE